MEPDEVTRIYVGSRSSLLSSGARKPTVEERWPVKAFGYTGGNEALAILDRADIVGTFRSRVGSLPEPKKGHAGLSNDLSFGRSTTEITYTAQTWREFIQTDGNLQFNIRVSGGNRQKYFELLAQELEKRLGKSGLTIIIS